MITLPITRDGLGLVDLACQSGVLLGKLVVRSFLPGSKLWKELLIYRVRRRVPKNQRP